MTGPERPASPAQRAKSSVPTPSEIEQILALVDDTDVEYVDVEVGDMRLTVTRMSAGDRVRLRAESRPEPATATPPSEAFDSARPARGSSGHGWPVPINAAEAAAAEAGTVVVRAPMAGVFYRAPSPGAAPFVSIGSSVAVGDTMAVIEVMKLFSAVQAECPGTIVAIGPEDGESVARGTALVTVKPD